MSYAETASKAAKDTAAKIPSPKEVKNTIDPNGKVETVANDAKKKSGLGGSVKIEEAVDNVKKDLPKIGEDLERKEKDVSKRLKKDYDETKSTLVAFFKKIGDKVVETANSIISSTSSGAVTAKEELKNPVVATQTVVGIGAFTALVVAIQDRHHLFRFKTDGEISAVLAGIIGFVALDGFLFQKYYPKYSKK